MDNIKDVVKSVIGELENKTPMTSDQVIRIWEKIVTSVEKKHSKVVNLKNGKLFVAVDSPAGIFQIKSKKDRLLRYLREEIPQINDIVFFIGKDT